MRLSDKQLFSSKSKGNVKERKEGLGSIREHTQKEIYIEIKVKILLSDTTCIYLKEMKTQTYIYIYIYIYI